MSARAEFSPCRTWRYWLERPTGVATPLFAGPAVFVMHNPSIADEFRADPTVSRCVGFARRWGHSRVIVVNRYALVSTDPAGLTGHPEPIGAFNLAAIGRAITAASFGGIIVCAWGALADPLGMGQRVVEMAATMGATLHHLGLSKHGHPKHPLYLRGSTQPMPWRGS